VLAWFVPAREVRLLSVRLSQADRKRHKRNYAHGELPEEQSFYFRGPSQKLNLRAHNLSTFLQLADGVDDETWLHHLKNGDYSRWLRDVIKDDEMAAEVAQVEGDDSLHARQSREKIRTAIEERYTAPA